MARDVSNSGTCIPLVALMPHAPVLIPEVGRGRERRARCTVEAMWKIARCIVERSPDRIVIVSPHTPRKPHSVAVWQTPSLRGTMERFGNSGTSVSLPNDSAFAGFLEDELDHCGVPAWSIESGPLDHGVSVPLYFLNRCGWSGNTVAIGLSQPSNAFHDQIGRAIRRTASNSSGRTVVIASGDMSHRLIPGAPAGYHPGAADFDGRFVSIVERGEYPRLRALDAGLQECAAEDVVDSTIISLASVHFSSRGHRFLSYEGPFGVGYSVAILYDAHDSEAREDNRQTTAMEEPTGEILPEVARASLHARLSGQSWTNGFALNDYLSRRSGVFVTIRDRHRRLRGCRGTLVPSCCNLVEETAAVAVSSALRDNRFQPVQPLELPELSFEVSVLHAAEKVSSWADLNPVDFGIIVTASGGRRGLMLPGVDGLETVAVQIEATLRKAAISSEEPFAIERFRVDKFLS